MPSDHGQHAQFVFKGLKGHPTLMGKISGTHGLGWMVTFPRALIRKQLAATTARVGYTMLRIDKEPIYRIFSVTLRPLGGKPYDAWVVLPVGTGLSLDISSLTLMVYRDRADIVIPSEGQPDMLHTWACEILFEQVREHRKTFKRTCFGSGYPEVYEDPAEQMAVQRTVVEEYAKAFGMTLPVINLVLDTPFNRTANPSWIHSPVMEEPMRVYTLPDGSLLTIKPSGPIWEAPPPYAGVKKR